MKIGIAISTTSERNELSVDTQLRWNKYAPNDALVLVHLDNDYRGVAYSKNKCLDFLYRSGCEHLFLADDDTYPISYEWWKPYVEHKEPHLMYQFKLPSKPKSDMKELYRDDKTVAYSHTRGAMIYVTRDVLDTVGGFDEEYNPYGFEHADYTNRIHNAGLTTHRAMDVPNSHELFYCIDQDAKIESSIPKDPVQYRKNYQYYRKNRQSKEFKEYKS